MKRLAAVYWDLTQPTRFFVLGASICGYIGCIVGLAVGLNVHPSTAWFAAFEVGIPSAAVGGLLGTIAGLIARRSEPAKHR